MKSKIKLILIAVIGMALGGCNFGHTNDPTFEMNDLYGYWLQDNTEHYVRFTNELSDENPYRYGYEWDEADEVFESDVLKEREDVGRPGNGWFKYWLEEKGDLHEIHLMSNDGAEIPKEYIVAVLTDDRLEYYEKDNKNHRTCFSRVVKSNN